MSRKKHMPNSGAEFMRGKGFAGRMEAMGKLISEQVTKAAQKAAALAKKEEAAAGRSDQTDEE